MEVTSEAPRGEGADLAAINLAVTFSAGVGLATWHRIGSMDRELALYRRMHAHLGGIQLVSYGAALDTILARRANPLRVHPTIWLPSAAWTGRLLWLLHGGQLRSANVIKTNQIPGSQVALDLQRRTNARLVVRCGYVWSLNRSRETTDAAAVAHAVQVEREAFEAADIGIVTTEANRSYVIDRHDVSPEKIRVVPNYVDVEHFRPRPKHLSEPTTPRIGYIGRLAPEKNLKSLVEAVSILGSRSGDPPELLLVGDGPLKSELEAMCDQLKVRAAFAGSVPHYQLPERLWGCQSFVLPSQYEGHPKALLEAMACGLPVVGCDVPGVRDEIEDGVTGLLSDTSAEGLANALDRLLSARDLRNRLGTAAAAYVKTRYSLDETTQRELRILRELAP